MKLYKTLCAATLLVVLPGCANLHDVDVSWCDPEKPKPKVETLNLSADALFAFDRYAQKDLLPKGRATLDKLVETLNSGYVQIDKIELVGHTDRLGSTSYNQQLGLNRAKTVKAYLSDRGLKAPIGVASMGETQPVTDGCYGVRAKQALTDCLQPDRRVVVTITGIKKVPAN